MQKISSDKLQQAIEEGATLHLQDKAAVMEKFEHDQPVLFESIAIQRHLGHDPDHIQVLFDLLLIIQLALDKSGVVLTTITQEQYLAELNKFSQQISFSAGLGNQQHRSTMDQYFQSHSEPALLLITQQIMNQAGFAELATIESKQLTLAGITLVNCVAKAQVE